MLEVVRRLRNGLTRTRDSLIRKIDQAIGRYDKIDEELLEEIETILLQNDVGVETTLQIIDGLRDRAVELQKRNPEDLMELLREIMVEILTSPTKLTTAFPHVIMMVGVNGTGKTTTAGKLAARYTKEGKKVLLVAADTFRAAAIEQLEIWAKRADTDIVRHQHGSDPSAVVFDAIQAALARKSDIVIIDTAGRLHTKENLMEELKKIKRTLGNLLENSPHEILLVLDSTTGQNALSQARVFNDAMEGLTGIVLTKLDGTARGGMVFAIGAQLAIPVQHIGVGEKIEDLQNFNSSSFVNALFD
tara:strand:+ start:24070 stop:24978 length:909 start_codon:yes stop_codon:yes gene_type:complete